MIQQTKYDKLILELESAEKVVEDKKKELYKFLLKCSENNCPHKIGDVITVTNSYIRRGCKIRIDAFDAPAVYRHYYAIDKIPLDKKWAVRGTLIKKDGTPSLITDISEYGEVS